MYKCGTCGLKSNQKNFFRFEKSGLFGLTTRICEACSPYRAKGLELQSLCSAIVFSFGGAEFLYSYLDLHLLDAAMLELVVAASLLTLPFPILVHESGHALMAKALNFEIIDATIGTGPVVRVLTLAGVKFVIRRYIYAAGAVRAPMTGEALSIKAGVAEKEHVSTRRATIRLTGTARQPVWILDWQ